MDNDRRYQPVRRRSSIAAILNRTQVWYWTPFIAAFVFITGVAFSLALHFHYSKLDGKDVGSLGKQQWALFFGTAFAYFTQVGIAFAVRTVSVQYLWRALKKQRVTIGGVNAAFSATSDPLAFLKKEIWTKTTMATTIAFMSWFIPITTFLAPATLNVQTIMRNETQSIAIPVLDIANPEEFQRFSYTINSTTGLQKFLGPRTIISRIGFAAATTGDILRLPQPATNASYEQVFYGPYVQCSNSTQAVRSSIDDMVRRFNVTEDPSSSELVSLDYFAAVPALSNLAQENSPVQIANLSDLDGALYSSNQLWIRLWDYQPSLNFSTAGQASYLTCELFNASYNSTFMWQNGVQKVDVYNLTVLNLVPYPTIETTPTPESQVIKSYSSIMFSLANQLTGSVAFYRDTTSSTKRVFSVIRADIAKTVLLGSSSLNSHFLQNHLLGLGYGDSGIPSADDAPSVEQPSTGFSDQRLQDMTYVSARPLDVLIPELSKNITISLLTDSLLAPNADYSVNVSRPATIYVYQSQRIAIMYPTTISLAGVVMLFGAFVFYESRVSHDTSFSSIACSTRGIHSAGLGVHESIGALPLSTRIKNMPLQFYMGERSGLLGFGIATDASGVLDEEMGYSQVRTRHDSPV